MFQLVSVGELQPVGDVVLTGAITAKNGKKLFESGDTVTQTLVDRLIEWGVQDVIVHDVDLEKIQSSASAAAAAPTSSITVDAITRPKSLRVEPAKDPFIQSVAHPDAAPYNTRLVGQFQKDETAFLAHLDEAFNSLLAQRDANTGNLHQVSDGTCGQIAKDRDLVLNLASRPTQAEDAIRRRLHVGKLATCIGVTAGLNKEMLSQLSIGCFIHDLGVEAGKQKVCQHTASPTSLGSLRDHPNKTLDVLEPHFDLIPETSLIIAHQMHERCDGSGYPCGRSADEIHDLTKIAAVADMFAALVAPGPGREPILPYHAMKSILVDVKRGLFDSNAVRAMLNTLSVCPVGSFVEMSDGRIAEVIRANKDKFNRPVVQICDGNGSKSAGEVVNLAENTSLEIRRAVETPTLSGV